MKIRLPLGCAAIALLLANTPAPASAQILYSQLTSTNPVLFQLRQVNGDGSGDRAVELPFADVQLPAWSRDAGLFAISAPDPNRRPNDRSYNVFAINAATGAITPVTFFQETGPDPQTGAFRFSVAHYKAFSPDRNAMAISSSIVSREPGQGTEVSHVLEVYTSASRAAAVIVHVYTYGRSSTTHHGGEGVDWHPAQNLLVAPVNTGAPYQNDPSRSGQVTALYRLELVNRAVDQGRYQQITFPRTAESNTNDISSEHDYQPKFSPNGVAVAYVRSFQNLSFSRGGADPNVQSLRILNLNTGADSEVLRLPQGGYVDSLDWSADGTALVFAFGQQRSGTHGFDQISVPQTNEIYVINVDGTGLRRLRGAGATTPAWKPPTSTPPPPNPSQLVNIATRMHVGRDPNQLIGGFIIDGSEPKKVIILATGPSLGAFGIQDLLADPVMELYQGDTLVATNDNWKIPDQAEIEATGVKPGHDLESALVRTLTPGTYTAVVRGTNGPGVGTVQLYDLSPSSNSKLANISSRGFVETADDRIMIAGIIIGGDGGANSGIVVRATAPSLSSVIAGVLPDPTLELKDANGSTLVFNDDWQQSPQAADISARGLAPSHPQEPALVASLSNGAYTAIVRGKGGETGVAVVEVYNVQ